MLAAIGRRPVPVVALPVGAGRGDVLIEANAGVWGLLFHSVWRVAALPAVDDVTAAAYRHAWQRVVTRRAAVAHRCYTLSHLCY